VESFALPSGGRSRVPRLTSSIPANRDRGEEAVR
jgi:hypothetical protein